MVIAYLIQTTGSRPHGPLWLPGEIESGLLRIATGLVIALAVHHLLVRRIPWPRPFRLRFVALHLVIAPVASLAWASLYGAVKVLVPSAQAGISDSVFFTETLIFGVIFYAVVAGVTYAAEESARATRAEALLARTQLAALRSQLHPHFLFNALHTVVQLIPVDPTRAAEAAELLADLLRTALEEQRDEVTLGDEWSFVSRYLAVERIRFGDRLVVRADIADMLLDERVPAFAIQTLVENAIRHGAAPSVAATEIVVAAERTPLELRLSVRNSSGGGALRTAESSTGTGTGLARLRERLVVLYGGAARLECGVQGDRAFLAVLIVPRQKGRKA